MKSENFIGIYPDILSKDECQFLINSIDSAIKKPDSSPFVTAANITNPLIRKDYGFLLEDDNLQESKIIRIALSKATEQYSNTYFPIWSAYASSNNIKLQKTPPRGGFHHWHCESSDLQTSNRILVWTIYLNDVPDGEGETEFLWQGTKLKPKAGTCVIWPAAFTHVHRGNPVYSCDKYIATGWYTYDERQETMYV
ncbi:2OG-Fe(II) oxygenase [Synechococcus phage S-CAM9]|uniref:2OG-Fe(II) oxygenase n=1 Tax=Synechococcus phage S-CAM9 TaxID=1883369 RepID=A0A1D8KQ73_9CAUD|nr:2OG-Fe(II) oxygenase [Synechococcus phage S-CAM9]AOV60361.1 2OG-Fe(II) oxygenase [Synechococcus phage S-CAM9]AOV60589.1 2OG-Fe(II) oxygenase [Synechococcus phage S-CAM9]AOV60818.1 2OG-Fe(II) oxygenase [Synechococcus phage S-CAM9]